MIATTMPECRTTGDAGDRDGGLLSPSGRELLDCLRLNGLDVDVRQDDPFVAVQLTRPDGTALPTVRFHPTRERSVLIALAAEHCSNGQWVRMSYYDGLPLQSHRV